MTENIGLSKANLATYDFSDGKLINAGNIDTLMKGGTELTVNEQGNLIAIKPPQKRDNFLVVFFKSYIIGSKTEKAEYKANERLLDNMEKLLKNASFQKQVINSLLLKNKENGYYQSQQSMALMKDKLEFYLNEKKEKFTTDRIVSITNDKAATELIASGTVSAELSNVEDYYALNINGEKQNVFDFISKNCPRPSGDHIFNDEGKLDDGFLTRKLVSRCVKFSKDLAKTDFQRQAAGILDVLRLKNGGTYKDAPLDHNKYGRELLTNVSSLLVTYKEKLSEFARKALEQNKDKGAIAKAMYAMLQETCDVRTTKQSATAMSRIFNERNMALAIEKMPQGSNAVNDVQGNVPINESKMDPAIEKILYASYSVKDVQGNVPIKESNKAPESMDPKSMDPKSMDPKSMDPKLEKMPDESEAVNDVQVNDHSEMETTPFGKELRELSASIKIEIEEAQITRAENILRANNIEASEFIKIFKDSNVTENTTPFIAPITKMVYLMTVQSLKQMDKRLPQPGDSNFDTKRSEVITMFALQLFLGLKDQKTRNDFRAGMAYALPMIDKLSGRDTKRDLKLANLKDLFIKTEEICKSCYGDEAVTAPVSSRAQSTFQMMVSQYQYY